jgi:hypothetical protein
MKNTMKSMLNSKDIMCPPEVLKSFLRIYLISGKNKEKKYIRNKASKSIKRARNLGLLPFSHINLEF